MKKIIFIFPLLFLFGVMALGTFLVLVTGNYDKDTSSDNEVTLGFPAEVLAYKSIVEEECRKNNIPDKVNVILAIMSVESGGKGNDVMQSSESLGLPPNTLMPLESIKQGVKYYAGLLASAKTKGIDEVTAIGAYNFGGGYLDFVSKNGKKHSLEIAEKYSKEVVAPSLGNTTGVKYAYNNPIADNHGNYLYLNGGNFYYIDLVQQYLSSSAQIVSLEDVLGKTINGGQCYGLTAYYVEKLGGPNLMGSGKMYASKIGTDYNWSAYGWTVIINPKFSDIKAGDVINFGTGGYAYSEYGHTGIICAVGANNQFTTYEQNAEKGQIVAKYTRTWGKEMPIVTSIVRKNK